LFVVITNEAQDDLKAPAQTPRPAVSFFDVMFAYLVHSNLLFQLLRRICELSCTVHMFYGRQFCELRQQRCVSTILFVGVFFEHNYAQVHVFYFVFPPILYKPLPKKGLQTRRY